MQYINLKFKSRFKYIFNLKFEIQATESTKIQL